MRHRLIAPILAAAMLVACGTPTEGGRAGLALGVSLPRPLAAVPATLQSQADVTELTEQAVRIELFQDDAFVLGRTVGLDLAEPVELPALVPGENYSVVVHAGLRGAGDRLGVIQFEGVRADLTLLPEETVAVGVTLAECVPRADLPNCDPTFGFYRDAPAPPTLFTVAPKSSCRNLVVAGRKPEGTVVLANETVVPTNSAPPAGRVWTWNVAQEIPSTQNSAKTLTKQMKSAWADQQQIVSTSVTMQFEFNPSALCFNGYNAAVTDTGLSRDGGDFVVRWTPGARTGRVAALLLPADAVPAPTLTALPVTADTLGRVEAAAADRSLRVAAPTAADWGLFLYAESSGNWLFEGSFLYHADWIATQRPELTQP